MRFIRRDVVDILPKAELVTLSGVGHLIPLESPETLVQNIDR